jgi:predicted ATPase
MLRRLYAHNFRCLENFEFKPGSSSSALLIGKNGAGKSTVLRVLGVFQALGRGTNRVSRLVNPGDFTRGRAEIPIRLELDVVLNGRALHYTLALELPERFRELRVLEERLVQDGIEIFSRQHADVIIRGQPPTILTDAHIGIDWHLVALPVIQDPASADALRSLRDWMSAMVLLAPIPQLISGDTQTKSLEPQADAINLADWLSGLLDSYPSAYPTLIHHLQQVMPDLEQFLFERTGKEAKSLLVRFRNEKNQYGLPFVALSDGEKCFFLGAVLLAANQCYGPLFACWDEPDNHLALNEISTFVMALRQAFHRNNGQILVTSHNSEAIQRFSDENTWVLGRRSRLEPTVIRPLEELAPTPDLIQALIDGDLDPWQ